MAASVPEYHWDTGGFEMRNDAFYIHGIASRRHSVHGNGHRNAWKSPLGLCSSKQRQIMKTYLGSVSGMSPAGPSSNSFSSADISCNFFVFLLFSIDRRVRRMNAVMKATNKQLEDVESQ